MTLSLIPCPHCGTYRLLGDPCDCLTKLPPVIIGEGDLDDQVRYAVRCACGEDRIIKKVEPADLHLPAPFPRGTRLFHALSISSTCECSSPCEWIDNVYWCADRSVVVKQSQIFTTLLGNVIRQLKGE